MKAQLINEAPDALFAWAVLARIKQHALSTLSRRMCEQRGRKVIERLHQMCAWQHLREDFSELLRK